MRLTKIRLTNFKCFADSGEIPIAPLTMVFGRNNSGKSSILQSLLLLRQTLDSPEYGPRLNLGGPLYTVGSYGDIVHQHRSKRHITMRFALTVPKAKEPGELELVFSADEPQPPRLARLAIRCQGAQPLVIRRGKGRGGPYEMTIGGKSLGGEARAGFFFAPSRFFPFLAKEPRRVGRPSTKRDESRRASAPLLWWFEELLRGLRAVGAFRQQPLRRYEYAGRVPHVMDVVGKNVVNALIEDSTRRGGGQLLTNVNEWLKAVGRVRLMPPRRISPRAKLFEVRLKDLGSGQWASFADVGFGIGQALPVFVEGLRTPKGGTFVVQEPEIHLHPDAQLGMADFLVSLARSGRNVIAETHSENFLLRIRRSVLRRRGRARSRLRAADVSIIYVDRRQDGSSRTRALEMDETGQIKNWPRGFMEEATAERMELLSDMAKVK